MSLSMEFTLNKIVDNSDRFCLRWIPSMEFTRKCYQFIDYCLHAIN